jgi:hypothetical protein
MISWLVDRQSLLNFQHPYLNLMSSSRLIVAGDTLAEKLLKRRKRMLFVPQEELLVKLTSGDFRMQPDGRICGLRRWLQG